jgi:hypothetical protein
LELVAPTEKRVTKTTTAENVVTCLRNTLPITVRPLSLAFES